LDKVRHAAYDCFLVDMDLPDLENVLDWMRTSAGQKALPVLALGGGSIDERIRVLEYGMEGHFSGPLEPAALLASLRPLLTAGHMDAAVGHPALDKEHALSLLLGNTELYGRLLSGFVDQYTQAAVQLRGFVSGGQDMEARILAHSIKGLAANLGGPRLQAAALEFETALATGDDQGATSALGNFEVALDEFVLLARMTLAEMSDTGGRAV